MGKQTDTHDMELLPPAGDNIVLFYPFVAEEAIEAVRETLQSRWIGQGPKVDLFERRLVEVLSLHSAPVAVGATTDALHLAYVLAGIGAGDEVISPVFTCTATNLPLFHQGATIRFADIQPDTMNIDPEHVRSLVTDRTKAIVCMHYGGLPCDMDELREIAGQHGIPVIEDAAHAFGASYKGAKIGDISEYTVLSFQAVKHISTGDGGMLLLKDHAMAERAKRLRFFGIDRKAKFGGYWENDITEAGFKYQMNDVAASIGLAALDHFEWIMSHRRSLWHRYVERLADVSDVECLGAGQPDREHAAWLMTVALDRRTDLGRRLRENGIESGRVHFRNDHLSVFHDFCRDDTPNMDKLENRYLVLPLHTRMTLSDVDRVCDVIRSGW